MSIKPTDLHDPARTKTAEYTCPMHPEVGESKPGACKIFTEKNRAEQIAQAIIETAHTGMERDGIVVILPVEKVFRIRTKAEAQPDEI